MLLISYSLTAEEELSEKIQKAKQRFEQEHKKLILDVQDAEDKLKANYRKVLERELKSAKKKGDTALAAAIDKELKQLVEINAAEDLFGVEAVADAKAKSGSLSIGPSKIPIRIHNIWSGFEIPNKGELREKVYNTFVDAQTNTAKFTMKEMRKMCGVPHDHSLYVSFEMNGRIMYYTDSRRKPSFKDEAGPDDFGLQLSRNPDETVIVNYEIALQEYLKVKKGDNEAANKK